MRKQAKALIIFAEKDLLTVSEVIERPELTNIVAFHCQQAIEKILKAFILENRKPLVKTHNLLTLDLFDNLRYDKMKEWDRERRRKKPKMKYSNGCLA